ncbi:hypothetical protein B0H13DRAFT_1889215 [Mycena leptocephala]|nr:hypothetical protein B0H13DRAFT_1889215 [Mycena leptocephala]
MFDPLNNVATAKKILTNHLIWGNHHIPSPLISVSTSLEKPLRLAGSMKRYHGSNVDVLIAEIFYDVEPSSAYHMMKEAKKLGVDVPRKCVDHDEYVFYGHIPLEHMVRIEQIVEWTNEDIPAQYTTVWEKTGASPARDVLEFPIEAMQAMSLNPMAPKDALDAFGSSTLTSTQNGDEPSSESGLDGEVYFSDSSDFCAEVSKAWSGNT